MKRPLPQLPSTPSFLEQSKKNDDEDDEKNTDQNQNDNENDEPAVAVQKKKEKREYINEEIVSTEQTYVNGLRALVNDFMAPLSGVLSGAERQQIFSNVESLLMFHEMLLDELEQWLAAGDSRGASPPIAKLLPFLKMYAVYVNGYSVAQDTIVGGLGKEQRAVLDTQCQGGEMRLMLLLGTPVQRIPRYVMLLRDLVKHTSREHAEYEQLVHTYEAVSVMAEHINEQKRDAENRARLRSIAQRLHVEAKDRRAALSDSVCGGDSPDVRTDDERLGARDRLRRSRMSTMGAASVNGDVSPVRMPATDHEWNKVYFAVPTWCSLCSRFLFGVTKKQGYECGNCKMAVHRHCRLHPDIAHCVAKDTQCASTPASGRVPSSTSDPATSHSLNVSLGSLGQPEPDNVGDEANLVRPHRRFIAECGDGEPLPTHIRIDKRATLIGFDEQLKSRTACKIFLFNDSLVLAHPRSDGADARLNFIAMIRWFSRRTLQEAGIYPMAENSLCLVSPRSLNVVHQLFFGGAEQRDAWQQRIESTLAEWNASSLEVQQAKAKQSQASKDESPRSIKNESDDEGDDVAAAAAALAAAKASGMRCQFCVPTAARVANKQGGGHFTAYVIEVTDVSAPPGTAPVTIIKRFSQLWSLKHALKETLPKAVYRNRLTAFPPKIFFDNLSPMVIQERCVHIEQWLNSLNNVDHLFDLELLRSFFTTDVENGCPSGSVAASSNAAATSSDDTAMAPPTTEQLISSSDDEHPDEFDDPLHHHDDVDVDALNWDDLLKNEKKHVEAHRERTEQRHMLKRPSQLADVLYDFEAQADAELSVRAGDQVGVIDTSQSPDWWYVKSNGLIGFAPSSYLVLSIEERQF
jgi:RhoGEF domain/Variant SH3 domain/Phorbol esters/diacylglycerol binding domain (C1 domain)/PX domain